MKFGASCFKAVSMVPLLRFLLVFLHISSFSLFAQSWTPLDSVHINSGNPAFPFPQFLPYQNPSDTLGNLATHSGVGVTHAEMEQTIRDAYRIAMNRASKPGGSVGGTDYVYFNSDCNCTEGDGYGLLAAVAMADKKTFDGMWLYIHDKFMNNVKRYSDCQMNSPSYIFSHLPSVYHILGQNSAADGDVDIGLALLCAYYQWGEFMGINDACGNPISYKKEALAYLKTFTDTVPFSLSTDNKYLSGDIGFDGYFKGGDSWGELTDWAQTNGPFKPYQGKQIPQYVDYIAPSYYKEFAQFLQSQDPQNYAWNISQFTRAEASSDWLMGQLFQQNPRYIPYAGNVVLSVDNVPTFTQFNEGEDFRLAWRTILNSVWHGNSATTWDPVAHQVKAGTSNSFEQDIGLRYAKFLWDVRQSPWNNPCVFPKDGFPLSFWGPAALWTNWKVDGSGGNFFPLNWIKGTGSPSAVVAQDFNLMAQLYRQCEVTWQAVIPNGGYLDAIPYYFHEWFRLFGMLLLSGNYQAPSTMKSSANMKIYMAIDKTFGFEGDSVTYTIDYRNYGSLDAQSVTIVDTLHKDFVFLSATGGGAYNPAAGTVTWNIGTVPGFKTATGTAPTKGQVVLKVKVGIATQPQYRNHATITCSNGSGWTSNEYPNDKSSVMERNFLDIAKRALVIKKSVSIPNPKAGDNVTFTINFKNTSDAGWINGGRPGVQFAYSRGDNTVSGHENKMRFHLYHDADEGYIDYGNYRFSYFLYDTLDTCLKSQNGCTKGWDIQPGGITEGVDPNFVKIFQEKISPGQDSLGKWNQRVVVQFSDPTNPNRTINLATIDWLLLHDAGNLGTQIHKGGMYLLRLVRTLTNDYGGPVAVWNDDWSWDPSAVDKEDGLYWPITKDWTDPDSANRPVTTWNRKSCEIASHTVKNILVEEWDGYTWRRVAGNGPLPGRDVNNVVIRDTVPAGLMLNPTSVTTPAGFTQTINGNVITWTKTKMQVKDSGVITFTARASSSCPLRTKRVVNRAWISADKESPFSDSAVVTLTCDSINIITPTKSTLILKDPSNNSIPSGDTAHIDTTVFNIVVNDKDQDLSGTARDTVRALIKNPSSGDSLIVKLVETGVATGVFQTASPVAVVSLPPSQRGPNQISTSGGQTVYITYIDQFDSIDISQAYLITLAAFPVPLYGWILDANGDGRADSAMVVYSKALTADPDSLRFYFPDQINFQTVKAGQGAIRRSGNVVTVSFASPFGDAVTSFTAGGGAGFAYMTDAGTVRKFQFPVADSIGPIITAAQAVERASGAAIDTLYVTFSEALQPASLKGVSLILIKNNVSTIITIDTFQMLTPTRFVLACATGTPQPQPGDSLRINPVGPIRDLYGNPAHLLNPAKAILLKQIPPIILKAYYVDRDANGADGYVDTAVIRFNKKVVLSDLSFQFDWGSGLNVADIQGDTLSYAGADSTAAGIAMRIVFPYTGLLKTSGDMFVIARFKAFPGESRQATVADSAAPVIDSATYYFNSGIGTACDTLRVLFSEPISINQSLNPFSLSGKSASSYTFALSQIAITGKNAEFCVSSASTPGAPQAGDTIWIAANNSVADGGGVFQNNKNNRKVALKVVRPPIKWSKWTVSIACNPFTAGTGFICAAAEVADPGTVIIINPIDPSLAAPAINKSQFQIFDALGNCIFESQTARKRPDGHSYYFAWDGRNKNGRWAGSGVYRAMVVIIDENGSSSNWPIRIGVKR